ncbi:MAG: hypothetical protein Q9159_002480 [Coniocarpon cinnabarinum]
MHSFFQYVACAAAVFTTISSAAPVAKRQSSKTNVLYWGADPVPYQDLSAYCKPDTANIINLGFVNTFGHDPQLNATFGKQCHVANSVGNDCESLGSEIQQCQSQGIKIYVSVGGWGQNAPTTPQGYTLTSEDQANDFGQQLYDLFAGPNAVWGSGIKVDGFDFDPEGSPNGLTGDKYYQYTVNTLKGLDSSLKFSASPQCATNADANIIDTLQAVAFDAINVQFYNNPNSAASEVTGDHPILFDEIHANLGASQTATLSIGLVAKGVTDNFHITPEQAAQLYKTYSDRDFFGGFMTYSAGYSDADQTGGCTYAQNLVSILKSGAPCGEMSTNNQSGPDGSASANSALTPVTQAAQAVTGSSGQDDSTTGQNQDTQKQTSQTLQTSTTQQN